MPCVRYLYAVNIGKHPLKKNNHTTTSSAWSPMYLGVGVCAPLGVGITEHPVPASPQRMEKKEEYGVPWLWKRVPVGTRVKGVFKIGMYKI